MPRRRVHQTVMSVHDASALDVDLMIGGHPHVGMTDLEALEVLRAAWMVRRDDLLAQHRPGERPGAWWIFDRDEGPLTGVAEVERLIELEAMDEAEMNAVVADAESHVERFGLAFAVHGQVERVARGNVIQRFRGCPEWGTRP